MPRVRIGAPGQPEVMAQSVLFPPAGTDGPKPFDRDSYNDLLEEVYNSIVTEVYRQLKDDVQRKIDLLPTNRFRGVALLHEAEDYARSNTLHAYEEARELYRQAAAVSDPDWRQPPKTPIQRLMWRLQRSVHFARQRLRGFASRLRPRIAELDLLSAQALIGYARMQLFRRSLASLTGHTVNAAFEARPVAFQALARVRKLSPDMPGVKRALFDAQVTLALAHKELFDTVAAIEMLQQARGLDPRRADDDPVFIFAKSLVERQRHSRVGLLRRAVELSPRFEVAQFQLAMEMEQAWRLRDVLEDSEADLVLREYGKLLKTNPCNLGGWANSGYICWLLGSEKRLLQARQFFQQGLRFKAIKREIFVAELDYGLARISAETGEIPKAYEHAAASLSAIFARESDLQSFRDYFFEGISEAMQQRFERYRARAVAHLRKEARVERATRKEDAATDRRRIRAAVHAFVLNDLGEAYQWRRNFDRARKMFRRATRCDPSYALPHYNLGLLGQKLDCLERVVELQPRWPQGRLALAQHYAEAAPRALDEQAEVAAAKRRLEEHRRALELLEQERRQQTEEADRRQREYSKPLGLPLRPGGADATFATRYEDLERI